MQRLANPRSGIYQDHLRSAAGLLRKLQSHQQLAFIGRSRNYWCHNKHFEKRQAVGLKDAYSKKRVHSGREVYSDTEEDQDFFL